MNYSVNLSSGQTVEVVIGEAAQINVEQALNYIESGRVEITKYVNEWAKPEIANYTNEYAEPIVAEIVNQTTKPLIDDYLNTTTKPQIDEYVADNVKPYADSAQDSAAKAKISKDNAKTSETNAKASELAAASSAGVASDAAVTATEAKDYTANVLTDENLKTVGQDLQSADSNIKTVATNILNVNTVAKNIDNVNLLAPHTEAMEALAPDIMDVVTVAGIAEQTKNVSENMTSVVNVSNNKTNINNVSANISDVNNVSKNMADVKKAVQSANDAKLWAVGTITEKPEGSSKYWAEQAKNAVQTPDATETVKGIVRLATSEEVTAGTNDSAVITPLKLKSNLDTKQDKSTAVNYNNISNCITYIPQDIKLELNNGTLTLKAGSKVYNGNGLILTTDSDKTLYQTYDDTSNMLLILKLNDNSLQTGVSGETVSSLPSPTTSYKVFYNTIDGKCYYDDGQMSECSLPIALVSRTTSSFSSIDQVFNGFGYIGSTVFALPGVKGLIPNGRNADGSLKSIEFTLDTVKIDTIRRSKTLSVYVYISSSNFYTSEFTEYDEDKNVNYDTVKFNIENFCCCGSVVLDNNLKIISFTPKKVFHALDYNDKSTISGWSMPSSRYIDLTLGRTGTRYTAPTNGYFYLVKLAGNNEEYIRFNNSTKDIVQEFLPKTSTNWIYARMEAQKGDVFEIMYTAPGDTKIFRFIFAEGEN